MAGPAAVKMVGPLTSLVVTPKGGAAVTITDIQKSTPIEDPEISRHKSQNQMQDMDLKVGDVLGIEIETHDYANARSLKKGTFCSAAVATFAPVEQADATMTGSTTHLVLNFTNVSQQLDINGDAGKDGMPCKIRLECRRDPDTGVAGTCVPTWA